MMEEDFSVQINDTLPITTSPNKTDESKPLHLNKQTNETANNSSSSEEPTAKYRNLESETSDGGVATQITNVQLQFETTANGSVWSIPSSSASTAINSAKWYRHPKVREHWKVVVASFVLFFIGLCLCIVGIILEALQVQIGGIFMLFVIGIICFIPGVYHVIAVYYAVKGKRGFSFYNLPLFN